MVLRPVCREGIIYDGEAFYLGSVLREVVMLRYIIRKMFNIT